jgi:CHAD domain-containing protein
VTLKDHVRSHTVLLLKGLAVQVRLASTRTDEESVHDLRVAIRQLRECLRMFKEIYPPAPRKKIRKELRKLMSSAELVRSADIALSLMKEAGLAENDAQVHDMREQRAAHRAALRGDLASFASQPYTKAWREALKV